MPVRRIEKLPVRLVVKQNLRQPGHDERIDDAEHNSSHDGIEHGGNEMTTHKKILKPDEWQ